MAERDTRPRHRIVSLSYLKEFVKGDPKKSDYLEEDHFNIDVSGMVLYHGRETPRECQTVCMNIGDKPLSTSTIADGKFEFAFSLFEEKDHQARLWLKESPGQIVPLVITTRADSDLDARLRDLQKKKELLGKSKEIEKLEAELAAGEMGVEKTKCHFCSAEIAKDALRCEKCKSNQREFRRFCTGCGRNVDLKANECLECGKIFPMVLGKDRFAYVVCGHCKLSSEIDDWMAVRNLPFLFQTRKGNKVGAFTSVEAAARAKIKYFFQEHIVSIDALTKQLENSDESPWEFASLDHAKRFIANFPCLCGHTAWRFSAVRWVIDKTKPYVKEAAKKTGSGLMKLIKGAAEEWQKKK